jgi:hypothetical protein
MPGDAILTGMHDFWSAAEAAAAVVAAVVSALALYMQFESSRVERQQLSSSGSDRRSPGRHRRLAVRPMSRRLLAVSILASATIFATADVISGQSQTKNVVRPSQSSAAVPKDSPAVPPQGEGGAPGPNLLSTSPEITTQPAVGLPGTRFQVSGKNYPAHYKVTVSLWRPDVTPIGPVVARSAEVMVDGDGTFTAIVTAPRAPTKRDSFMIDVRASTMDGGVESQAPFLVHEPV